MSALDDLKNRINSAIYSNNEQDITGDGLQSVLDDMVDTMGVSVSQNTDTGHTDITVGDVTTPIPSVKEVGEYKVEEISYTEGIALNFANTKKEIHIPAGVKFWVLIECDETELNYGYLQAWDENDDYVNLIYYPDYLNSPNQEKRLNKVLEFTAPQTGIKYIGVVFNGEWITGDGTIIQKMGFGINGREAFNKIKFDSKDVQLETDVNLLKNDLGYSKSKDIAYTQGVAISRENAYIDVDIPNGTQFNVYLKANSANLNYGYLQAWDENDDTVNLIYYPNYIHTTLEDKFNSVLTFTATANLKKIFLVFSADWVVGSGNILMGIGYGHKWDNILNEILNDSTIKILSDKIDTDTNTIGIGASKDIDFTQGQQLDRTNAYVDVDIPNGTQFNVYISADSSILQYGYLQALDENDDAVNLIYYPNYIWHPGNPNLGRNYDKILTFTATANLKKIFLYYTSAMVLDGGQVSLIAGTNMQFVDLLHTLLLSQKLSISYKQKIENNESGRNGLITPLYDKKIFWSHMFLNNITEETLSVIPSQSLFDVEAASRLGFKYIEANVQTTSDGKYVVIHGYQGKFWWEVEDTVGGTDIHDVSIGTKTLTWIQENVRYRTSVPRFRTTIPTLEQFCEECLRWGLLPSVQCINNEVFEIVKGYFGDSFAVYGYSRPKNWAGLIMPGGETSTDVQVAIANCELIGKPSFCNISTSLLDTLVNNNSLKDYIAEIHKAGYLVSCPGNYTSLDYITYLIDAGVDMLLSSGNVNDFDYGNIHNIDTDGDYSDFTIQDGSVSDGVLSLQEGGSVSISSQNQVFLGKGSLHIRFNGSITLTSFGQSIWDYSGHKTFISDGVNSIWLSTFFMQSIPGFSFVAEQESEIYSIKWKSSKV